MKKILLISLLIILIQTAGNSQFTKVGGGIAGSTGFHFNMNQILITEADFLVHP